MVVLLDANNKTKLNGSNLVTDGQRDIKIPTMALTDESDYLGPFPKNIKSI